MIFKILTLFPEFFKTPFESGLLGKAVESGKIDIEVVDLRSFSEDKFRRCDDYPYGGGSGMVLMPGPIFRALESIKTEKTRVYLTSASGEVLNNQTVKELSDDEEICIICGHYEGIDQRIIDSFVDKEISIGDYVLSGGEYAALVIIDAIARHVPGFMSNEESLVDESFENGLVEYPQFTRPAEISGMEVPEVLLSGHHENISNWRFQKSLEKTRKIRPDLYKRFLLRKILGE